MKDKITVLEVLDAYYPSFDGPTVLVTNYAKSFLKRGDTNVELMVPAYPNYEDKADFPIHRIRSVKSEEGYRSAVPFIQRKSVKIMRRKENPFDIVHAHSPFLLGRHAIKQAKKMGIPSVITMHTRYHEDFNRVIKAKFLRRFMMRFILKTFSMADYTVCVSDGTVETLKEYGYKKDNVTVIRNGTDLVCPKDEKALIDKINEKENLAGKKNVFLSVGRIVENKKLDIVVDALKILKERGVEFTYVCVGAGSHFEKLKKHVEEAGISENVIFTGKVMDRELLSGYYLRADLFLFPSTFDTASLAPIEAAALKLPTVMTKGCSTAEIITDNRNGFLVEEDAEKWADKIESIVSDKEKLASVKELAGKEVYRSWDSVCDEVRAFYVNCIKDYKEKHKK